MLGVTFKEDCPDMRNTKVVDIIEELKDFGAMLMFMIHGLIQTEEKKWYTHGIIITH